MNNYSDAFLIAVHEILTGVSPAEITAPNGDSSEWERRVYSDLAATDSPKKRMAIYNQYTAALKDKPELDGMVFNPPEKPGAARVDYVGSKIEKSFKGDNYVDVLNRLGYEFKLCDLDETIMVNGQQMNDFIEAEINMKARDIGLSRLRYLQDAYFTNAKNNHYNPIIDYFTALKWNGVDWIETLAAGYLSDEYDLIPVILRRWLIGVVARIMEHAQNRMLVLDGAQNIGKSTFAAWLASPLQKYFMEGGISPDDKDHQIRLTNTAIWEVSEMGSTMRRADIEALKSFLTQRDVKVRHPYGHHAIQKPAICSFIGTVNNIGGFLNDASGSRRYMATTILSINYAYKTEIDINQIWAQAYALYKAGEPWILEGEEKTIVDETNKKFEIENPVAEMIQTSFTLTPKDETNFVSTVRLIEILHDKGWGSHNPVGESMVIATAAKILKLKKSYQMDDAGQLTRGYSGIREKFSKI